MEKHNSHILLESISSHLHYYEKDKNGNIKVDSKEDAPHHLFVEKKKKLDIKHILLENNNLINKEYEKSILSEDIPRYSDKNKKNIKDIKSVNINKIQSCLNEVNLENDNDFYIKISDRKKNSFDFESKNNKKQKRQKNKDINKNYKKDDIYEQELKLPLLKEQLEYSLNSTANKQNNKIEGINLNDKISVSSEKNKNFEESKDSILLNDKNKYIKGDCLQKNIIDNNLTKKSQQESMIDINNNINSDNLYTDENNNENQFNIEYNNNFDEINDLNQINSKKDEQNQNIYNNNNCEKEEKNDKENNEKNNLEKDNYSINNISQEEKNSNNKNIINEINNTNINDNKNQEINNNNKINESKKEINKGKNIDIINVNTDEKKEIKSDAKKEKKEKPCSSKTMNKFNNNPLEESQINLSYDNVEIKNRITAVDIIKPEKKRNKMPYIFKEKRSNKNININKNRYNNLNIFKNKNRIICPEDNKDIQSNHTEIKIMNRDRIETNEINDEENKSVAINKNEQKYKVKKEEKQETNNKRKSNMNKNINDENNKNNKNSCNDFNNMNANITKEKEDINLHENNNNENNFKTKINNNITENKPSNVLNNNKATSRENLNNEILSSAQLSKNNKNEELNKNQININIASKKNEPKENGDNLSMLSNKNKNKQNDNDLKDNADIINNDEFQRNGLKISNGNKLTENNKNKAYNETRNNIFKDNDINKGIMKNNSNENKEINERMSTEEFLEKNLIEDESSHHNNSNPQKNGEDINRDNYDFQDNSEIDYNSNESEFDIKNVPKKEMIFLRQIIPLNYIYKIRQKEFYINPLVPKKKRVFITKISSRKKEKQKGILIPPQQICYMTNQYIIKREQKILIPIINNYFFQTKLIKYNLINTKSFKDKLPKIYKKIIVSPGKNSFFFIKNKGKKYQSIIKINETKDKIDINYSQRKNKKEKINIFSKDKEILDNTSNISPSDEIQDKEKIIILKKVNKVAKRLSQEHSDNNLDISIQFTNKTLNGIMSQNNIRKIPIKISKKGKYIKEKLFKALPNIKIKINNKDDYKKKNNNYSQCQRHFGNENYCTLCQERRQRGLISEHVKGLHGSLSFRDYENLNYRPLSRLRITMHSKEKNNNFFGNNNIVDKFKKKLLQYNRLNKTDKFNNISSIENLGKRKYRNDNEKRNFRVLQDNIGKSGDKNRQVGNKLEYSTLKIYFNK